MYKFQPILKSLIWGGEKIAPYKGIATDQRNIGESWELSGVKDNESVVAEGPEAGTSLPELIARHGAALLGKANYGRFGEEFPPGRISRSRCTRTMSWHGNATNPRARPKCGTWCRRIRTRTCVRASRSR